MLQNCSIWNVASIFFLEPTTIHSLAEISRKTKLAHTSVKNHLLKLVKEKIINLAYEKKNTRTFPVYKSNSENENYLFYKKLFNLEQLHTSKLIEEIIKINQPKTIILYGSYARGEDSEISDIDIFVNTSSKKSVDVKKFELILRRKIDIKSNLFENLSEELQNNILNGITLHGYVEVNQDA